jgi:hypothetical protein
MALLKAALDLWCACWFWPAEALDDARCPDFADPPPATHDIASRVAADKHFFHCEIEFPEVFSGQGAGFDALVGNPPGDIAKPNSKEFFSNIDPLYRTYGKQDALRRQTGFFEDAGIERGWLDYNADFRAQSNFMGYAASPFGDPDETRRAAIASPLPAAGTTHFYMPVGGMPAERARLADPAHPSDTRERRTLISTKLSGAGPCSAS